MPPWERGRGGRASQTHRPPGTRFHPPPLGPASQGALASRAFPEPPSLRQLGGPRRIHLAAPSAAFSTSWGLMGAPHLTPVSSTGPAREAQGD